MSEQYWGGVMQDRMHPDLLAILVAIFLRTYSWGNSYILRLLLLKQVTPLPSKSLRLWLVRHIFCVCGKDITHLIK